jgi:tripartite-type tricarboxylate transporter receptor subunit TctC
VTSKTLSRRQALTFIAGAVLTERTFSQSAWPDHTVKFIVPAGAGTGIDVIARLLADQLSRQLGQPFVVENVTGAAGIVGTERALRAPPDGYTYLVGFNQIMSINPHLYAKLPYDPVRGVAPVSLVAKGGGYVLIAGPTAPFNTFDEFIRYARAHPGELAYGSSGTGSIAHLGMELLKQRAGIDLLHVPYRTGSDVTNDLISGRIHVRLETVNSAVPLVRGGRIKALAVSTASRKRLLPDVPTFSEQLPGFSEIAGWNAVWAPANTPAAIVERMARELAAALRDPKVIQRISDLGTEAQASTPAELAQLTEKDFALWGNLIKQQGIKSIE